MDSGAVDDGCTEWNLVSLKNRIWRFTLLLVAILSAPHSAAGDVPRHWTSYAYPATFEHVSVEQGLSQSTVRCIFQDKQGFLWFGTESGLNRYDGNGFLVFQPDIKNQNGSIGDRWISAILQDHRGLIWIATDGGLSCLDPVALGIRNYRGSQDPGALSSSVIRSLAEDPWGNLWIGTGGNGLCMLPRTWNPGEAPRFQSLSADDRNPKGPPLGRIDALCIDKRGDLWIGSREKGLYRAHLNASGEPPSFDYFPPDPGRPDSSPPSVINTITEDASGSVWAGTNSGLFHCDPDGGGFHRYTCVPGDPSTMAASIVRRLYVDRSGTLWVCNEGGLSRMLPRQRKEDPPRFRRYQHDPKDPRSLSSNGIQSVFEDLSGVLWVGAYQAGLNKLILNPGPEREKPRMFPYRNNAADPGSLTGNLISAIGEDRFGNLWVGTDGAGLNRVIPPAGKDQPLRFERFRAEPGRPGTIQGDVILAIHLDSNNQFWLGTYMNGLIRVDQSSPAGKPRFTQFKRDANDPQSLADDFIRCILDDGKGRLWIGTHQAGLNLFDPKTHRVKRFSMGGDPRVSRRAYTEIHAMEIDTFGTLWMATREGLIRFNPETEECRTYAPGGPDTLSVANVQTVHIDGSGRLWAGTLGGGLDMMVIPPWNGSEPKFKVYDVKDGLPSNVVRGILEDGRGQLWLSLDRTLCRFDPAQGRAHPFTYQRELQRSEFVKNACFRSPSGELFFGGNDGFSLFHPGDVSYNTIAPPIAITDFQVLNKTVSLRDRMRLGSLHEDVQEIAIYPGDTVFSFNFAALHYVAPDMNQYAYMMEGLDHSWKTAGNNHTLSYTTLPPGDYILRVKASNCDGIWSTDDFKLKIRVIPPWYKTLWFRVLLGGVLAGAVYVAVQARIAVLRGRNRVLKEMVASRTKALAEANEALRDQSLTDPLTGLRNRRFLYACMPEDVAQVQRIQRDVANNSERMKLNIDVLIILVDIDHFKGVNDRHGHPAGDKVLQQMGVILQSAVRGTDTVVRWGGEEFLVIARNSARADAMILPERIRRAVEAHAFEAGEAQPLQCTCSLGFSVFPFLPNETDLFTWEQIIELADICLYAAKRNGRNAWVGIVPDTPGDGEQLKSRLPETVSGLVKMGLFPVISSLLKPICWDDIDNT